MQRIPMTSRLLPSNIPLHCNICHKKPDFSDVSHLLTHIASKGHLSTYYKIKVKASSEDSSRQIIQEYDTWYAHWNIEDLMSDRLSLKEKRKSKVRGGSHGNSVSMPQYHVPPPFAPFTGHGLYDHAVDPRLVPQTVKTEVLSRGATPIHAPYMESLSMAGLHHMYGNPTPFWHPSPYMYMQTNQDAKDEVSSEELYVAGARKTVRGNAENLSIDGDGDGEENDSSKLKGVFWPGMDMFDAAPPEQRRKRNQKKDTSVVKQLEATSKMIDATEHIFSPSGSFCRSRPISGLPDSEDSPLPGEETPPRPKKAKRGARRKPLVEKDANTSRKPDTKPQKRGRPTKAAASLKHKPQTVADENGSSAHPKKRKNALSVFRDDEVTLDRPAEMNTLTSAFCPPTYHQRADTRPPGPVSFRSNDAAYLGHQGGYYPYHGYYSNAFALEASVLPPWDYYANDTSGSMVNPLFLGADQGSEAADDDDQTISVPDSEQ